MMHAKRLGLFGAIATVLLGVVSCFNLPTTPKNETVAPLSDNTIDSLFTVLVERVQIVGEVDSYTGFSAIDFTTLATAFNTAVAGSPDNVKANAGCMVANIMALNGSASLKKMVDSIDAYMTDVDAYFNEPAVTPVALTDAAVSSTLAKKNTAPPAGMISSLYTKSGLPGLGSGLVANAPLQMAAVTQVPTFPRFLKLSYIQDVAENEVVPALDKVIAAAARLEALSAMELVIVVDGDTTIIDKGDIYIVDAGVHLVRGMLKMYSTYDYDLYTSATDQTYSWVDDYVSGLKNTPLFSMAGTLSVTGDTLYKDYTMDNSSLMSPIAAVSRYNYSRSGFMTIRHANHASAYADLTAVPALIKSGITSIRGETGDQAYDLIPRTDILDWDQEMVDMPQNLIDQGISSTLANNFQSPEALMDFISQLLAGEVTFHETIKGRPDTLTINLSAWFTNPVTDLRTLLPRYRIAGAAEELTSYKMVDTVYARSPYDLTSVYYSLDDSLVFTVDPSRIASRDTSIYGGVTVTLNDSIHYNRETGTMTMVSSIIYLDSAGNDMSYDTLLARLNNKTYFPYFNDYTINGIFPDMTRQKWLDLVWR